LTAFKIYGIIIKNKGYKNMLKDIQKMCEEKEVTLLYLVKFGSHLYGTDTSESDVDYKGIFLPSKEQCFLQNVPKSITYSTGKNDSKNTEDDVDIQLWSLQYFLQLLSKGEINALDLCFSFTYPEVIEHKDNRMNLIFDNHKKFFNVKDCNAYISYSINQSKKYGIKGSRLGKIK
jgi:predicted nucleotidyltransferase